MKCLAKRCLEELDQLLRFIVYSLHEIFRFLTSKCYISRSIWLLYDVANFTCMYCSI